jgi:hypothetical protein
VWSPTDEGRSVTPEELPELHRRFTVQYREERRLRLRATDATISNSLADADGHEEDEDAPWQDQPRALVVALGVVLAAHEDAWTTDTWRHPSLADARYLTFLMANGYPPSDVEQLVLGAPIPAPVEPERDDELEDIDEAETDR